MKAERLILNAVGFGFFLIIMVACKGGNEAQLPVDLVWDRQNCDECKMALSDRHYAAQVIDAEGKAAFFDDIGCAILWLNRQHGKEQARVWVNDMNTTEWIEASKAHWISEVPNTPMGYGFAATIGPVDHALDFETVKKRMLSGKTLVKEHTEKHRDKKMDKKDGGGH